MKKSAVEYFEDIGIKYADIQFKDFTSEIKGIDKEEKTITAYVSTNAKDRMDEVLLPDGIDLKHYKKNPVVLFSHDYYSPPIAKALWIKKDGDGVLSKMQFANTQFAQEIFELYAGGFMRAFSVGFIPKEWDDGDGEKKPRRSYKKWELLEYSAVAVPANPEALTLAITKGLKLSDETKKALNIKEQSLEDIDAEIEKRRKEEDKKTIDVDDAEQKPKPGKDESKDDFMKRCIPQLIDEGKDQDQAAAICYSLWENRKNMKNEDIIALQQENETLKTAVETLNTENRSLRYTIYKLCSKDEPETIGDISGDELKNIIQECVAGEIRKVTGKVN